MDDQHRDEAITNKELQLELKALRSDVKIWILAAVAMNQFLTNVQLPTALTVPAIAVGVLLPAAKSLVAIFGGRA